MAKYESLKTAPNVSIKTKLYIIRNFLSTA